MLASLIEFRTPPLPSQGVPSFLQRRMDSFYIDRMEKTWGGKHIMHGAFPQIGAVQLMSNDYLSLVNHPQIIEAQVKSLRSSTREVVMSGVFMHGRNPVSDLESRLAQFSGYETAVLSQSGYAANVGLIQALADKDVPVYIDVHAHASLWEGIISAGATARPFRHNDFEHLKRQMKVHGPGVLCIDSVYSTLGSVAPLEEIVAAAESEGCLVIVDESHSLGTHGKGGVGLVAEAGLQSRVHFVTASMAKAFAGRAGLILCSEEFREYFRCTARPAIFSSGLLNHEVAGLNATLDLIQKDDWRRVQLFRNAQRLRNGIAGLGYNLGSCASQIIPIESGLEPTTLKLRETLERNGIFGAVFCAPATPQKRSMVRLSVNAELSFEQIDYVVRALGEIREEVGMSNWASTLRGRSRKTAADSIIGGRSTISA
jgi:CAI-1 autoinducer synthase